MIIALLFIVKAYLEIENFIILDCPLNEDCLVLVPNDFFFK